MKNNCPLRSMKVNLLICLLALFTAATSTSLFARQPGDLDLTFSDDGKLVDGLQRADDFAEAVAVQRDGKIVVVGSAGSRMEIARYNPDGSLDTSFDGDGKKIISGGALFAVVIQSDGKVVVAGSIADGETWRFGIIRLNGNGSFDTSFDGDGKVVIINGYGDVQSVALQQDGKIVAAGRVSLDNFALARYNPDGSLDTSFSGDGIIEMPEGGPEGGMATSVAIQSDGKILAGGGRGDTNSSAIVRYNTDGTLDTGFGVGGVFGVNVADLTHDLAIQADGKIVAACTFALVRINANGSSFDPTFGGGNGYVLVNGRADGVAIQSDGKIVLAGGDGSGSAVLWRFDQSGGFDTTFDGDGIANTGGSYSFSNKPLALQSDGKIVFANAYYNGDLSNDFHVGRLTGVGALDASFGGDGTVTTDFGLWQGGNFNDVAIQQDGKILALGNALARYNPDGSPDKSFGSAGKVDAAGESVAIQPDGKIVIVCGACNSEQIRLARYNTDGSLDTSFDGDGIATTPIADYQTYAFYLAIQSDGKIVAAGSGEYFYASDFGTSDGFLVRYNPDGSLDTTFDTDGVVHDGSGYSSVAIQSDYKIVTSAGYTLARYNSNGSLDTSFGTGGRASTELGPYSNANFVAIQPDGKIVAAGYSTAGNSQPYNYALVRFNSNGSIDTSFDGDGKVVTPVGPGWNFAQDVAIQPDGKIVAAGYSNGPTFSDFALARYNPNGSLDSTFGNAGITRVDFDNNSNDFANGMALDAQGRAVVVGQSDGAFALARFILGPGAVVANHAPFDFDGDGKTDISAYRPSDGNWYLNRSRDGIAVVNWGNSTDVPVPSDYDNDNKTDVAVYRPSTGQWFILKSSDSSFIVTNWGNATDRPVAADYDGDSKADIAVYRPSTGEWFILKSSNNAADIIQWGNSTDLTVPGSYDSDNKTDIAVYRPSTGQWFVLLSTGGGFSIPWGLPGDKPVPADYDGDGKDDIAAYRPSDGNWYYLKSSTNSAQYGIINWGNSTDMPVPGDYDGDGTDDVAVFRPSTGDWFVLKSTSGYIQASWGIAGDKPLPASYIP